jgi:hypothetical protein
MKVERGMREGEPKSFTEETDDNLGTELPVTGNDGCDVHRSKQGSIRGMNGI